MKFTSKVAGTALLSIGIIVGVPPLASAHCDTPGKDLVTGPLSLFW